MVKEKEEDNEVRKRMHSIVLKEKDKDGNLMYLEADTVTPAFPYGEGKPVIMAGIDDRAYFIPVENINWIEQNYGVKGDVELAKATIMKKVKAKAHDVSVS